jgi:acyl-coenzyme A synthetase/AMP-(fatty) acid ligase
MDSDGFLFFNGRDDDVIKSSGYRYALLPLTDFIRGGLT